MIGGSIALASNLGLVGTGAHPYSLSVNGEDLIAKVPMESIAVTEAGPGAVSSMHFTVWDTDATVAIDDGAEIRLHDNTRDLPMFGGFLERWSSSPAFGGSGRILEVSAYGYEAILDSVINPSFDIPIGAYGNSDVTIAGGAFFEYMVLQALVAQAPLRGFADVSQNPSQATPIGRLTNHMPADPAVGGAATKAISMAGMTLRQAFLAYIDAAYINGISKALALTVDFYRGVRLFGWAGGYSGSPSDYATLTINDTAGGAVAATDLKYEEDHSPGAIVNAVYVKGAAAASTGWVVGDTTTGRREAYTTTDGTTEADKQTAGRAILDSRGSAAGRGTFRLENFTPINAHPGSQLIAYDANMGWSDARFFISEISKDFVNVAPGKQNWVVSFFTLAGSPNTGPASLGRLIRTLTRGTAF